MTEIQKVSYYKWKNLFSGENYGIRKKAKACDWWECFLWDRSEVSGRKKEETGSRKKTPAERAEEVTSALSANLFNSSCCSHIHYFRSRAEEGWWSSSCHCNCHCYYRIRYCRSSTEGRWSRECRSSCFRRQTGKFPIRHSHSYCRIRSRCYYIRSYCHIRNHTRSHCVEKSSERENLVFKRCIRIYRCGRNRIILNRSYIIRIFLFLHYRKDNEKCMNKHSYIF